MANRLPVHWRIRQSYRTYYIIGNFLGDISFDMNQSLWLQASPATYIAANQSLWVEASPTTYLSHDDPIFFIAHGTNDTVVPIDISESFASKLDAAGIETHFARIQGGDHDILTSDEENLQVRYSLEPLLKKVFNLQPESGPWYAPPLIVSLVLVATLVAAVALKKKPDQEKTEASVSGPTAPVRHFFFFKMRRRRTG
jgi:acetyl esterase/lipase